jgi:hypothetical protein
MALLHEDYKMSEDSKPEFELFDLTQRDISEIEINKSHRGNCLIVDKNGNYYCGFILNIKSDGTKSICKIIFHPSGKSGFYIPRLTFTKEKKDGSVKEVKGTKVRIAFDGSDEGLDEFWKMINFLSNFKDLVDTGEFKKRYGIVGVNEVVLRLGSLPEGDRAREVAEYASKAGISIEDVIQSSLHNERRAALKVFYDLLNTSGYIEVYRTQHSITVNGEEVIWHHFLKTNEWILGLNLDIRFVEDFTSEVSVGNPTTENKENPQVDLMGISDYTILVELKTATTEIFTSSRTRTARAGTWSFTSDFLDGFSQCLAQKFDWDKESKGKTLVKEGNVLDQNRHRTLDPKVIFIIGNKIAQFPYDSANIDHIIKRDTFERFRRNNRNVEIITYDELYQRANFIVIGKENREEDGIQAPGEAKK